MEADDMKRHREEMRKMSKRVEANHEKRIVEAFEQARENILNNGSTRGTNDAVPDLSMPSPMNELFDEK